MKKLTGRILLIDDSSFEKALLQKALRETQWDVAVDQYEDPLLALEYLKTTSDEILAILSDMKMPKLTGLELKKEIDRDIRLRRKAIPFIFFSTRAAREDVVAAYEYGVQGYFRKPMDVSDLAGLMDAIIRYWVAGLHPNKMK